MGVRVEKYNPDIITWAIERNNYGAEDFYATNPKVQEWVAGEAAPTLRQLEELTRKLHIPFGYVFLDNPPIEQIGFPFFRAGKRPADRVALEVYNTIQQLQDRQNWLKEYLAEIEFPELDFVGKYTTNDNYFEVVADIRRVLKIDKEWLMQIDNAEDAFKSLIRKVEDAGIIVTINGVVGNNTHRPISLDECRGFVLVDKQAPFLFINNNDTKGGRLFTLIHELAHIWIGKSAGFNNDKLLPFDDPTELFCDKVAAEFLVPETLFRKYFQTENDYKRLAGMFRVSPVVIARRALDLGFATRKEFFTFYNAYMQAYFESTAKGGKSGGNFYATAKYRVSLRFAAFVDNAIRNNALLFRDAYRLTNLKGESYHRFMKENLLNA